MFDTYTISCYGLIWRHTKEGKPKCYGTIALIGFKRETEETDKARAWQMYQTLGEDCGGKNAGILHFQVGWNLDRRKDLDLVEIAVFTDQNALVRFRTHPKHAELAAFLREIADWGTGDIPFDPSKLNLTGERK